MRHGRLMTQSGEPTGTDGGISAFPVFNNNNNKNTKFLSDLKFCLYLTFISQFY